MFFVAKEERKKERKKEMQHFLTDKSVKTAHVRGCCFSLFGGKSAQPCQTIPPPLSLSFSVFIHVFFHMIHA
jgi:hypothetical protein